MSFTILQPKNKFILNANVKTEYNFDLHKGAKIEVKKIKKNGVYVKLISPFEECSEAIERFNKILIRTEKTTIKELEFCIDLWKKNPKKFKVDKSMFNGEGHCINTGYYKIPKTHPDVYGMASMHSGEFNDAIMTHNYKHVDGVLNKYSYQKGNNEYYSLATYEFMKLASLKELEHYQKFDLKHQKYLYGLMREDSIHFTVKKFSSLDITPIIK